MGREPYNREKEHTPTGEMYPAAHGGNYPELPVFYRPILPSILSEAVA